MGGLRRKNISFDIDTKELEIYYPKKNWRKAYDDIKIFLCSRGFSWIEGSTYTSKNPMTAYQAISIIENLLEKHPFLHKAMRDMVITEVGEVFSANFLFDKNYPVKPREEYQKAKVKVESKSVEDKLDKMLDEYVKNLHNKNKVKSLISLQKKYINKVLEDEGLDKDTYNEFKKLFDNIKLKEENLKQNKDIEEELEEEHEAEIEL